MLKLALVFFFGAGTVFVANAGRVHHSGLQPQLFNGTAMKVAPDPSNAWSFHETVTIPKGTRPYSVPVVVDFDHNKRMDTEIKAARVVITDVQVSARHLPMNRLEISEIELVDDTGVRWSFPELFGGSEATVHFATPLVLPVDSALNLRFKGYNANPNNSAGKVHVNMIGRLVTM